ncbi:hypothetical protein ACG00X_02975 [Roseateles sp. BYS96W]|uniref:Uncharacterized protein n=2 Tax=Pelomonas nitida TaxID=3299027 RepID=A0ABW7G1G6_9BURK
MQPPRVCDGKRLERDINGIGDGRTVEHEALFQRHGPRAAAQQRALDGWEGRALGHAELHFGQWWPVTGA